MIKLHEETDETPQNAELLAMLNELNGEEAETDESETDESEASAGNEAAAGLAPLVVLSIDTLQQSALAYFSGETKASFKFDAAEKKQYVAAWAAYLETVQVQSSPLGNLIIITCALIGARAIPVLMKGKGKNIAAAPEKKVETRGRKPKLKPDGQKI